MDIRSARVALRERGLLDTLDLAVRFIASDVRALAPFLICSLLPLLALAWFLPLEHAFWIVPLAMPLATVPCTLAASRLVFSPNVSFGEVLRGWLRSLPALVFLLITLALALALGALVLLLPSIYFAVVWAFSLEVMLLERASTFTALGRAQRLTQGRFGEAFGAVILLGLMWIGGAAAFEEGVRRGMSEILQLDAPAPFWGGGGRAMLMGLAMLSPFVAIARFFVYLEFRTRNEGWDVQARFAALAVRLSAQEERSA